MFLFDGPQAAQLTVVLAHGAGAAMDSGFMQDMAAALAGQGLRVARFEFAYMAQRRVGGTKRPPPKVDLLCAEYRAAVRLLAAEGPLVIGGKSMGGRVASMVADDLGVAGLLCLGYPFHPIGKPEKLRVAHLATLQTPTLICQGTRDPFGTRDEVASYPLSDRILLEWLEGGEHDFKPRKRVSGHTQADLIAQAARAVASWSAELHPG
ncbi:hypothetical protein GGQ68_002554 [Sagittula marina]|uniref:KANL3/Tex30 alpha/beta hydrolase-like domain-containing protein n=1 Tax=Sagittula marina TaxID=943940 RepID=A0A7W6DR61_9RHOB|nr:alpha/beta family hydrolase [Sagittula marina]MBB3986216.1 hypothetical protein [Sagittula marina]